MTETADARQRVERMLAAAGVTDAAQLIVMHVSAGNPFRRWPADAFAELTAALARSSPGRRILLTSGPSDAGAVAQIAQSAREALGAEAAGRVVLTEELGLADLRVLVARAALYIGGDSGPLHLAATTRTPDRGDLRSDAATAVGAVARSPADHRSGGARRAAVPSVRPARVRTGRLPVPATDHATGGRRRRPSARSRGHVTIERRRGRARSGAAARDGVPTAASASGR